MTAPELPPMPDDGLFDGGLPEDDALGPPLEGDPFADPVLDEPALAPVDDEPADVDPGAPIDDPAADAARAAGDDRP